MAQRKKLNWKIAELSYRLQTEVNAVRRRPEIKKPAQKNPEGKKCVQEIWVGTKAQAQSPSYGTLQCHREYVAPKNK